MIGEIGVPKITHSLSPAGAVNDDFVIGYPIAMGDVAAVVDDINILAVNVCRQQTHAPFPVGEFPNVIKHETVSPGIKHDVVEIMLGLPLIAR